MENEFFYHGTSKEHYDFQVEEMKRYKGDPDLDFVTSSSLAISQAIKRTNSPGLKIPLLLIFKRSYIENLEDLDIPGVNETNGYEILELGVDDGKVSWDSIEELEELEKMMLEVEAIS